MAMIRYPLNLDTEYPPERRVLSEIKSVSEAHRARSGILRMMILIGHDVLEKQRLKAYIPEGQVRDGNGES